MGKRAVAAVPQTATMAVSTPTNRFSKVDRIRKQMSEIQKSRKFTLQQRHQRITGKRKELDAALAEVAATHPDDDPFALPDHERTDHQQLHNVDFHAVPNEGTNSTMREAFVSYINRIEQLARDASDLPDDTLPEWQPGMAMTLEEALTRLWTINPDYAYAVEQCHIREHSVAEVAAQVQRPVGTVKSRASRGRALLRAYMGIVPIALLTVGTFLLYSA